jgi:hypothetical protein
MATIIAPVIVAPLNDGIVNNFMNCWLSALLQMMIHWPAFDTNIRDNIYPLLQAQSATNRDPNFIRLFNVIQVLNTILPQLRRPGHQYDLTAADYNTIMDNLLPTQVGHAFQDFDESFQMLMELITEVFDLDRRIFRNLQLFKAIFTFFNDEVNYQCDNLSIGYYEQHVETILTFYELNTNYVTSAQELLRKAQERKVIPPRRINGINYCNNTHTYEVTPRNTILLISFSNNRHKCIYPNPILFVRKTQLNLDGTYNILDDYPYIINGAICYTGAHYYYISFDENGIPRYEYDDTRVTNVNDFDRIYTEMVFASYIDYTGDLARIPDFREFMDIQIADIRDRFNPFAIPIGKKRDLLEKKKDLTKKLGIKNDYLEIQYYEEMIKLIEPPNPIPAINWNDNNAQFYNYFFTSIPGYQVGNFIVNSVPDKELYDLFYIGDSFKEKYTDSIQVNTEHFKDTYQSNTKPTDKEVDIENIYNTREQLVSSTKKKSTEKYSMVYYTNGL